MTEEGAIDVLDTTTTGSIESRDQPPRRWELIPLPKITDPRGNLTFIESTRHVPFQILRVYYLYDVPGGAERGGHAHRNLSQVLISVAGALEVTLDDGFRREKVQLNRANKGLIIRPRVWRELGGFTSGAVCVILASHFYDESDYCRDYDDFLNMVGSRFSSFSKPDNLGLSRGGGSDEPTTGGLLS